MYLTKNELHLARVAGQVFNETAAETLAASVQLFAPSLMCCFRRPLRKRDLREDHYDSMDVTSDALLAADRGNVRYSTRTLGHLLLMKREGAGASTNVGRQTLGHAAIMDMNGRQRRLYLPADQPIHEIERSLRAHISCVQVRDNYVHIPKRKPRHWLLMHP
ncbi:MAG: hypothetical protein AMXMBFR4_15730 [Candidatus Hydrogenedentota bacterium]